MEDGEQHNPGGIKLEEQQLLPKNVFGENPVLSKEQETYHKEQIHIDSSIPKYRSLEDIVHNSDSINTQALLKNISKRQYKIQQQKVVHSLLSPSEIFIRWPIDVTSTEGTFSQEDMISLANMYCFVLTEGKHFKYSEKLMEKDIVHPDAYEAMDLIKLMVLNEEVRSIEDVLQHPFHWNEHQKLIFLCEACGYINADGKSINPQKKQKSFEKFNMLNREIVPEDWTEMLKLTKKDIERILRQKKFRCLTTPNVIYDLGTKHSKNNQNSLIGILRFIRNRYVYYYEDIIPVRQAFGSLPVEYWRFFSSRFPKLFMHIYQNMKKYILFQDESDIWSDSGFWTNTTGSSREKTKQTAPTTQDEFSETLSILSNFEENKEREGAKKLYPASHKENEHPTLEDDLYYAEEFDDNPIVTSKFIDVLNLDHRLLRRHRNTTSHKENEHPTLEDKFDDDRIFKISDVLDLDDRLLRPHRNTMKMLDVGVNTDPQEDAFSIRSVSEYDHRTKTIGSSSGKTKRPAQTIQDEFSETSSIPSNFEENKERGGTKKLYPASHKENEHPTLEDDWYFDEEFDDNQIVTSKFIDVLDLDHRLLRRHGNTTIRFKIPVTKKVDNTASIRTTPSQNNQVDKEHAIQESPLHTGEISKKSTEDVIDQDELCDCGFTEKHLQLLKNLTANKYKIERNMLNIKDANTMSLDQCKNLGHLVDSHRMGLRTPFDVTDEKLEKFLDGITKEKLKELDMSCSKKLTTQSFRNLSKFASNRGITKLTLCGCELNKSHVEEFCKQLPEEGIVQTLDELDLSFITTFDPEDFKTVGKIIALCKVKKVTFNGCELNYHHLQNFEIRDLKELTELDISCCEDLTDEGFRIIANIVANTKIKCLVLGGCELSTTNVEAFYDELLKENQLEKIPELEELNLGYNATLEPNDFKTIGQIAALCKIKKLILAGCQLSDSHLQQFKSCDIPELDTLDVGDNCSIGKGVTTLAEIVTKCNIQEINLSDCMVNKDQLQMFRNSLGKSLISRLNLSDYNRSPDEYIIKEVCELLPNITDIIYLQFKNLNMSCRHLLQCELNKLPKTETKIKMLKDSIVWQDTRTVETEMFGHE